MTRAEGARWLLMMALLGTVVSALAGSAIGVLIGADYIFIAVAATIIDLIQKGWKHGERKDDPNNVASKRR